MVDIRFTSDVSVELIDGMGDDARVAHAAWVSTHGQVGVPPPTDDVERQRYAKKVRGVIHYLMEHRHGTPFEAGVMQLRVHAPIFVWREWHRHRIASYNEQSARYTRLEPVFYVPPRDRPMIKVEDWKPGRPKFLTLDEFAATGVACRCCCGGYVPTDREDDSCPACGGTGKFDPDRFYTNMVADMREGYAYEYERYERQLARLLDPGLARDNLPVGIYSACWVTTNLRSLMNFLSLRTHELDAQFVSYPLYEIEAAARKVEALFAARFPVVHEAFVAEGRVAP